MLDHALALASQGYAVFPVWSATGSECACGPGCTEPGKHPVGGRGHNDGTTDEAVIRHWWGLMSDASIGIACAASGLLVLDVDPRNGGLDSLRQLETDIGELTPTTTVITGGGGYHFYYKLPAGFQAVGKLAGYGGIDVKVNGYVIAPPSSHASGNHYTWASTDTIAKLPTNLAEITRKKAQTLVDNAPKFPPASIEVLAAARAHLAELGPAVQGQGGDAHTYRVCATMIDGWGLKVEEALPLLRDWDRSNTPPWGEAGLVDKLRNAMKYAETTGGEARRAWEFVEEWTKEPPRVESSVSTEDPSVETSASIVDFNAELTRAYADLLAHRAGGKAGDTEIGPMFEPAGNLFTREYSKTKWLIRGLVVQDGVGATSGEPKSTKTWAAIEMALAIATNTPAFGQFETGPAVPVAMFLAEDSERAVRNRLRALAATRNLDPVAATRNMHVYCRRAIDLLDDAHLCRLIASSRMIGARLICLDPMRDIHSANEDSSADMKNLFERLRAIRTLCGASVLFVHHSHKDSRDSGGRRKGQKMRGSSAIHGSVDFGFYVYDLDTDMQSNWSATIESEIRDGRGAGVFQLDLAVADDINGEATRADWIFSRDVGKSDTLDEKKQEENIDKVIAALLGLGDNALVREIREKTRMGWPKLKAALAEIEKRGWANQNSRDGWTLEEAIRKARGALQASKGTA